jgi:hypothetical protein
MVLFRVFSAAEWQAAVGLNDGVGKATLGMPQVMAMSKSGIKRLVI